MSIKYTSTTSDWGIKAFLHGQMLIFSTKNKKKFAFSKTKKISTSIISELNVFELFSPGAKKAWKAAEQSAKKRNCKISPEDIFLTLLGSPSVKNLFFRFGASVLDAEKLIKNYLKLAECSNPTAVQKIPFEAYALSVGLHDNRIDSLMLLGSLLKTAPSNSILQAIFSNLKLTLETLEIFAVWHLQLSHEFSKNSPSAKLLYCCQQAENLEKHFGYFYEWSAIETALALSSKETLKDLQHKQALKYLVKAGSLAKYNPHKMIFAENVIEAYQKKSR